MGIIFCLKMVQTYRNMPEKLTLMFVLTEECAFSLQINGARWYKNARNGQLENNNNNNNNNNWYNSPFWAKPFFRSFCQLSLFLAAFLQFLSPNFLASSTTPSSHLSFDLLLCLLPSTAATRTLLVALCSSIRITCPAHFNRLILMHVAISLSLYSVYN